MTNEINTFNNKENIPYQYHKVGEDVPDAIPAAPLECFYKPEVRKRVAVYVILTGDDESPISSMESVKKHYEGLFSLNPDWILADIYTDARVSRAALKQRDGFNRMLADCRDGKIDLIVTKCISRFTRNVRDFITYARQLKEHEPPIGIFFEEEAFNTLDENADTILSYISAFDQERRNKYHFTKGSTLT